MTNVIQEADAYGRLPCFGGFYNTVHDYDNEQIIEEVKEDLAEHKLSAEKTQEILEGIWDFMDDKKFFEDYAKGFFEGFEEEKTLVKGVPDVITEINLIYSSLSQPRFYNYDTDAIIVKVEATQEQLNQVAELIKNNIKLQETIKRENTSRDGYISFVSNNYQDWIDLLNNYNSEEETVIERKYLANILLEIIGYYLDINTGGEFECNVAQGMETYGISYLNTEGLYKKHGVNTDDQNQPS